MSGRPSTNQAADRIGSRYVAAVITMHKTVYIAERARHKPDKAARDVRCQRSVVVTAAISMKYLKAVDRTTKLLSLNLPKIVGSFQSLDLLNLLKHCLRRGMIWATFGKTRYSTSRYVATCPVRVPQGLGLFICHLHVPLITVSISTSLASSGCLQEQSGTYISLLSWKATSLRSASFAMQGCSSYRLK